ncbi:MAG: efflux RND transporter periplasmic adaptor subunit [Xanthomonadales bacterium]|nr:efflux RND transporter periplasmic adaptor subunit [Xanthomonadales bacterium]
MDRSELVKELTIDRGEAPNNGRLWVIVILAALLLAGAGLWAYNALSQEQVLTVTTTVARSAGGADASASVLDATGYVTARRIATVSAKTTGKVVEVLIEEGMRVEQGQVLARLDQAEVERDLSLSKARLNAAQLDLNETQVRLDLAERELKRQLELVERKLAAEQTLDSARADRDALVARLRSSRGQVEVARRQTEVIEQQLDNTVIRAPFSGVIIAKAAQPGEMISPISAGGGFTRTGIGTIVDMDSLEIQVDVSESYINRVQNDQPVEARLNAYPDWVIPARVIAVIPTADRSKATVKVRIAIESKDQRIVPDMGVRVAFLKDAEARPERKPLEGAVVDRAALVDGRDAVFLVAESAVEERAVVIADREDSTIRVTDGLRAGDRVVLNPPAELSSGDRVKIK